mgnify:CR=1 FL=1
MAFYDVDNAMTVKLDYDLPPYPTFREGIRRAPRREAHLSQADKALAIRNALRYIHPDHHLQMARSLPGSWRSMAGSTDIASGRRARFTASPSTSIGATA